MSIADYIKINKLHILSNLATITIIHCILFSSVSMNQSVEDLVYMDLLILTIQMITFIYGFHKEKKKFEFLLVPVAKRNIERRDHYKEDFYVNVFLNLQDKLTKRFLEKEENYKNKMNELQEYITQWIHDVKVNIAVCELLLEEKESEDLNEIHYQIEEVRFRVNQVLHVTRTNHYDQDFTAEEVDVCNELRKAIKENARFFIKKNIEIETHLAPIDVISDKKGINYIFSQILNNSSKYTPTNGRLSIHTKEDEYAYFIHIKDYGIGIPKEDINRIFNKGFTGRNGRLGSKSTGMGLYYTQKTAEALSIGIDVKSEEGKYTEFILSFYKLSNYYHMTAMSH